MAEANLVITRRHAVAGILMTGTVACSDGVSLTSTSPDSGLNGAFNTGIASLEKGDHRIWTSEIGNVLNVAGGYVMTIASVELFTPYGVGQRQDLVRDQSFAVSFSLDPQLAPPGDMIHQVSHARYGAFDLFLTRGANGAPIAQAIFN